MALKKGDGSGVHEKARGCALNQCVTLGATITHENVNTKYYVCLPVSMREPVTEPWSEQESCSTLTCHGYGGSTDPVYSPGVFIFRQPG